MLVLWIVNSCDTCAGFIYNDPVAVQYVLIREIIMSLAI